MSARILLIEDEEHLALGVKENLEDEGYSVDWVAEGLAGLEALRRCEHELVLLDVMLPGLDGFSICQRARAENIDVPVLFLTARGEAEDRIQGLEAGGDDYLPKPFRLAELCLRVAAILRRTRWYADRRTSGDVLEFGGNRFDFTTWSGRSWDGDEQSLTQKEAMILKCLAERVGEVVRREEILEQVWGYDVFPSTRTVDNFILRLRKRFEREPEHPRHLHTVRGVGYRFTREPESPSELR